MKITLDTEYRLMKKENTRMFEPEDLAEVVENTGERREEGCANRAECRLSAYVITTYGLKYSPLNLLVHSCVPSAVIKAVHTHGL
jgi:hypothetical protein